MVALRKESVDRNNVKRARHIDVQASLSARRAWIEMRNIWYRSHDGNRVALRKESVDRNVPSAAYDGDIQTVALRKESVDRNPPAVGGCSKPVCRSPQGERG